MTDAVDADVAIAVHDRRRNIARAVSSALSSSGVSRVIVVCHNTPVDGIAERLGSVADDSRVVLEQLDDGIRSPAGPFNRAFELMAGRFSAIMGSDDELAPGAVDAWLRLAVTTSSDVVVPRLRFAGGGLVATPPTRPFRRARLDGVRDRLVYRTSPVGLVSRERFGHMRLTPGLETGEDLAYSTRLWFSGARIARSSASSEYRIHDDAERVTFTTRSIAAELAAVEALATDDWVQSLGDEARLSIAVKLWRIPVFGAVHYHPTSSWTADDRVDLARIGAAVTALSPAASAVLSRADLALVEAVLDTSVSDADLVTRSQTRRRFVKPQSMLTKSPLLTLARDAPVRFAAATWFASHGV